MTIARIGRIRSFHVPKKLLRLASNSRSSTAEGARLLQGDSAIDRPVAEWKAGSRWSVNTEGQRPARKPVILVAMDDSDSSVLAAEWATEMARKIGASVLLVHAVPLNLTSYGPANPTWLKAGLRQEAMARAEPIMIRAQASGVTMTSAIEDGAPAIVIARAAQRWHAQIIVMAAPKRGFFKQFLGGNTVDKVVRHADCPVIALEPAS